MNKTTWGELLFNKGTIITPEFTINSNKNTLLFEVEKEEDLKNGSIEIEYSLSYDDYKWADWQPIYENRIFTVANIDQQDVYIKFKITFLLNSSSISPTLTAFNFKNKNVFKVENNGDLESKPKLWITKINGDGDIKLHNLDHNNILTFDNLRDKEQVFVDCENEELVTNLPLTYRYDDHNDVFTKLMVGDNYLYGEGNFILDIKFQSKLR